MRYPLDRGFLCGASLITFMFSVVFFIAPLMISSDKLVGPTNDIDFARVLHSRFWWVYLIPTAGAFGPVAVYGYARLQIWILPPAVKYCREVLLLPMPRRHYRYAIHLFIKIAKWYHEGPRQCYKCREINCIITICGKDACSICTGRESVVKMFHPHYVKDAESLYYVQAHR